MDLPAGATVVELGCHESPFAVLLKRARPDVTVIGIDARETAKDGPDFAGDRLVVGDAACYLTWENARPVQFSGRQFVDAVIGLSSVEHFGLGWYGDPVNNDADDVALTLAGRRLRPDGWLYYDVPWHPDRYTQTAHYRRYTDPTLPHVRTGQYIEHARTWVIPGHESALLPGRPTEDCPTQPFYYVAVWAGV
jgi:SAM-dependent methyltransferase